MRTQLTHVRANSIRPLQAAALVLAITLTLSCSDADNITPPPNGGDASKNDCIREGLEIAANTLDYITKECEATRSEVLSQLSNSVGTCNAKDLEFDKPIRDIKRDCGVDEIPIANSSSSSNGNAGGGSSSSGSSSFNGSSNAASSSSTPSVASSSSRESSSSAVVPSSSSVSTQTGIVNGPSVTYEGETYQTVVIGTQTWMARNLNYAVSGSKCYNKSPANCDIYGMLYNWATAMALPSNCNSITCSYQVGTKHKGVCPSGWHIPSNADWNVLMKFVNPSCSNNDTCAGAGTKLKATSGWNSYSNVPAGTDEFGFSALPGGGGGLSDGDFSDAGYHGYWWSSSEYGSRGAYRRYMRYSDEHVFYYDFDKSNLFSVRCLQD